MKFTEENIKGTCIKKVEDLKPCRVCDDKTNFIDGLLGTRYCSSSCYDWEMDRMSKWARGERYNIK